MTFIITIVFGMGMLLLTTAVDNVTIIDAINAVLTGQPIADAGKAGNKGGGSK